VGRVWIRFGSRKKLEARKILESAAESPPSAAPMMMANDHFIREDEIVRPENALLCRFCYLDFFGKKLTKAAALAILVPIITVTIVSGDNGNS